MTSLLTTTLRLIGSRLSDGQFLEQVRVRSSELVSSPSQKLVDYATKLREQVAVSGQDQDILIPAFALADAALHHALGYRLHDVQIMAGRTLAEGRIAEMQTGEGKTFSALPAAIWGGLLGRGVHISTPNSYLAHRDCTELMPVYEAAGVSVGLLPEQSASTSGKREAYICDVTYGSGYEFGFDYLRDQLVLRDRATQKLGDELLQSLSAPANSHSEQELCQRGLAFAIVDEADNVLVDDATSPLVLSEGSSGQAVDAEVVRLARHVALHLSTSHVRDVNGQQIELTEEGRERIYHDDVVIPVQHLQRSWISYVETALRAERLFERDVHYVVDDGEIKIVDASTGRVFADRAWQSGLHQAVEAKEGLRITPERSALAQITRQRFYRLYRRLSGMTGTATTCRGEFKAVYNVQTRVIPLRLPSRRQLYPCRFFRNQDTKWQAIVESIRSIHTSGRPVLIGTRTIADSLALAERLTANQLSFQILNDRQTDEEASIIAGAGQVGRITISTNLAGRGTDIKLSDAVRELGGLHVIVSECHESSRIDRQMIGRAGRQGDPGSAQVFVAMDDWLIQKFGPWLATSSAKITFSEDEGLSAGEIGLDLRRQIARIQLAAERQNYAIRARMLRHDLDNDNLFED